jgi:hypothetical protein
VDVLAVPDGDDLDLDTRLANVNDGDDLVDLLAALGLEPALGPGLRQARPVADEDGGRLVDDLEHLEAGGLGGGPKRLALGRLERRRGGNDAAVRRGRTEEVGRRLVERLEEEGRHLGDGQDELLGDRLGRRLEARGRGRVLARLLAGGRGRRGDERLDLVARDGVGRRDDGRRRRQRGRDTGEVVEPGLSAEPVSEPTNSADVGRTHLWPSRFRKPVMVF